MERVRLTLFIIAKLLIIYNVLNWYKLVIQTNLLSGKHRHPYIFFIKKILIIVIAII